MLLVILASSCATHHVTCMYKRKARTKQLLYDAWCCMIQRDQRQTPTVHIGSTLRQTPCMLAAASTATNTIKCRIGCRCAALQLAS
jgi:hypothetical protein